MIPTPLAIITLAAGKGTRMRSSLPKVLHKVAGEAMLAHVLHLARSLEPERVCVVVGDQMPNVVTEAQASFNKVVCVEQKEQKGTAHAVLQARAALEGFVGHVLILYGDTPLVTKELAQAALQKLEDHAVVVLGMTPANPTGYGRLVCEGEALLAIVEQKDATEEQRNIGLCNSGIMAVQSECLWALLESIDSNNASGEFYLTDIVKLARKETLSCGFVHGETSTLMGVNSRAELAVAEGVMQQRLRAKAMEEGATLIAPETVFFSRDTRLGRDVIIHPHVVFGAGVVVEEGAEIRSFSHLEQCVVGPAATVGPFARLRPGTVLAQGAHIGNFVEIKNTDVGVGAKINHLSYVGDASVGRAANVGAGTITCNYDGFAKHHTVIGDHAFIGSNTALVAPVTIGEGAIVGAGSTITEDVPADALALTRSMQTNIKDKAKDYRAHRGSQKRRLS